MSLDEIRTYITADSLGYLSVEGLYSFMGGRREGFCDACFTGDYPVEIPRDQSPHQLHLFDAADSLNGAAGRR
jgi:amidophosphoribosyltransferase